MFALNDPDRGVTVNVGMIDGGLRANVVAPSSSASVDVRVLHQEDVPRVEEAIRRLRPSTPGVEIEVVGRIGRLPLEHTERNRSRRRFINNVQHLQTGQPTCILSRLASRLIEIGGYGDHGFADRSEFEFGILFHLAENECLDDFRR